MADEVFLIDLVPFPVNGLRHRDRQQVRRSYVASCAAEATSLEPEAVAVCHGPSFEDLSAAMTAANLPVIHQHPLPFPLGNWRERFAAELLTAVRAAGLQFAPPA